MKKNYFMLAFASLMLAACANNDLVDEGVLKEEAPQAIGFETFAEKATRAETATALVTHHDNYYVWGYKDTDNTYLVFDAQEVTAEDNEYTPKKYWDKAASTYYFYATAPAVRNVFTFVETSANSVKDQAAAYFTLTNLTMDCTNFTSSAAASPVTALKATSGDIDYMISTTTAMNTTEGDGNKFYNPVNFNFKHILSRLNVTVKDYETTTPSIELKSVKIFGLKTKASFNSSKTAMDERWNKDANTTAEYTSLALADVPTAANYVLECLVIPQTVDYEQVNLDGTVGSGASISTTITKPYVHVQYEMGDETYNAYYNLAALFGADGTTGKTSVTLSEAYQNTLNIIFGPAAITFSTTTTTWSTGSGSTTID